MEGGVGFAYSVTYVVKDRLFISLPFQEELSLDEEGAPFLHACGCSSAAGTSDRELSHDAVH